MSLRVLLVLLIVSSCSFAEGPTSHDETSRPAREALWVFSDEISSREDQDHLIEQVVREGFNTLYLSVYRSRPNRRGRLMYDEEDIARFITRAHRANLEVWAAYGNSDWPHLGCAEGSFPHERIREIARYNQERPDARFDGVMLDVEPDEPANMSALVRFHEEATAHLGRNGIRSAAAIRHFWKTPVDASKGVQAVYKHVIDLPLDHVVVMGYRNFAGGPCADNGLICLHQDQIAYAQRQGKEAGVLVGLRLTSVEADAGRPEETFFGMPEEVLDDEKARVAAHFHQYASFGGFATHRYRGSE